MRALLSVEDKSGIETFARGLRAAGFELISTGRTAAHLAASGIPVTTVADVTGFPEILGGRVKTLHPAIHGGILAQRDDETHMSELQEHQITPIDMVVCNLYPFSQKVLKPGVSIEEAIEQIDIGGVALLRAAAKNFRHVTVVAHPREYPEILSEIESTGEVNLATRRRLAVEAFQHTAMYDTAISEYLRGTGDSSRFPPELTIGLHLLTNLSYGENPHQEAALYAWRNGSGPTDPDTGSSGSGSKPQKIAGLPSVAGARVLQGKALSFNNLLDLDAALAAVSSFTSPTAVVVKHTNPCGLACADSLPEAYRRAHRGDPVSAYGGILGFNREIDEATANEN